MARPLVLRPGSMEVLVRQELVFREACQVECLMSTSCLKKIHLDPPAHCLVDNLFFPDGDAQPKRMQSGHPELLLILLLVHSIVLSCLDSFSFSFVGLQVG